MTARPASSGRTALRSHLLRSLALGALLIATRGVLERGMALQMVIQIPLLVALGAGLGTHNADVSPTFRRWNVQGAAGLLLASATVTTWMVPRMLDSAVEDWRVDLLKAVMLVVAGHGARHSWRDATTLVRVFTLGMAAWMTATVGMLLVNAPDRLCVSYALGDQQLAGYALIVLTAAGVVAALVRAGLGASDSATPFV